MGSLALLFSQGPCSRLTTVQQQLQLHQVRHSQGCKTIREDGCKVIIHMQSYSELAGADDKQLLGAWSHLATVHAAGMP